MSSVTEPLALPSGERRADPNLAVYGILAVGVSAVIVLGALFGAWLALRSGTKVWPPKGVTIQDYFGVTLSVTALMAALAGWWGLYGIRRNERRQATLALALVIFLEGAMINLLTYVIRSSGLSPRNNAYAVIYYALNVAMIAILATGMGVGAVVLGRVLGGQVPLEEPALGWAAAWYATFVSVAWLVMFTVVYVVQ
jgi:heme/copper-type cytochrome/quinol oxidase subunit 3